MRVDRQVRAFVSRRFPGLVDLVRARRLAPYKDKPLPDVFTDIYHRRAFGGVDSVSGPGSEHAQTSAISRALPALVRRLGVRSLLDAPCGDFHWMATLELPITSYVGIDIVADLVARNEAAHGRSDRRFVLGDITRGPLPRVDLVLCRDCLVHLQLRDALAAVRSFVASGSQYLLATTFPACRENRDVITGGWRPLNLELAPFDFPQPLVLIDERAPASTGYPDKSLGLWRLDSLGVSA